MKVLFRRLALAGLALYLAGSLALGIFLAEIRIHVPHKAVPSTPPGVEDVTIRAPETLHAWFAESPTPNGDAVVLLHGVADTREGMLGYGELFRRHGYAVLLPDARSHGLSEGIASFGLRESHDVRLWTDWLQGRMHPRCLYGMGESMGAAILLQSLQTVPRFCAVVAESPFAEFRWAAYDQTSRSANAGRWLGQTLLRPAIEMALLYARISYGLALADASPRQAVAATRTPVLLIHGLDDVNLQPYQSRAIYEARPGHANIELWEVPRAAHCGARSIATEEFDRRVIEWINRWTKRS